MRQYRFSIGSVGVFLVLVAVAWLTRPVAPQDPGAPRTLLSVERADVVAIEVDAPQGRLRLHRDDDGTWRNGDEAWPASRAVVRRMLHQLTALEGRARVAGAEADPARYGPFDVRVTLVTADARFPIEVGAPTPAGNGHYVRVGDGIFEVKEAAVDHVALAVAAWREERPLVIDPEDVLGFDVDVGGRSWRVRRVDGGWRAGEEPVDPDVIASWMGALSSLRVRAHGVGAPDPEVGVVIVRQASGDRRVAVGPPSPDGATRAARVDDLPPVEVDADALAAFDVATIVDPALVGVPERSWASLTVERGHARVMVTRGPDRWRWPSGAPVEGQTADRLASALSDLEALGPVDGPLTDAVTVMGGGAEAVTVVVGTCGAAPCAAVAGGPPVAVEPTLGEVAADLLAEYAAASQRGAP